MKRKIGLLLIFCLLITLSGCQQKKDIGASAGKSTENVTSQTPTPEVEVTPEPTDTPEPTPTPKPTTTPKPTETPAPTATPEPEVSMEPVVASEDITYRLDKIIPLTEGDGYFREGYITEDGFFLVYQLQEAQLRLEHYDKDGQFLNTTYQQETESLPATLSQDEYYWMHEDVLKRSASEQTDIPVMGMVESDLTGSDTYCMEFVGPVGTDGMLFYTWAQHTVKDFRLFKKVPPENVGYACTLGVICTEEYGRDSMNFLTASYNRTYPNNRVKIINYLEEGETYEQAFEKLRTDLINGNGPDILSLDKEHLAILYQENLLTDLGKQAEINAEDIYPGVREYFSLDGGIYAVPTHISVFGVVLPKKYNAELTGKSFREIMDWAEQNNVQIVNSYEAPYELLQLMIDIDKDEYINQDINQLLGEVKANLEYISKYDSGYENGRMICVEIIDNLLLAFYYNLLNDESLDVIGFTDAPGGDLRIYGSLLALQKNVKNREVAYSFLNWYLSGEKHVTDNYDIESHFFAPTISGCRRQQVFFDTSGWFEYEKISTEASERVIEFLKQSKVPQDSSILEDIIYGEGMDYLEGNISIEQATENIRIRVQEFLEKR